MAILKARMITNGKTSDEWSDNPTVLLENEIGIETDTMKFKFGNGTDYYPDLPYPAYVSVDYQFTEDGEIEDDD